MELPWQCFFVRTSSAQHYSALSDLRNAFSVEKAAYRTFLEVIILDFYVKTAWCDTPCTEKKTF
jgi:hypothetical protein